MNHAVIVTICDIVTIVVILMIADGLRNTIGGPIFKALSVMMLFFAIEIGFAGTAVYMRAHEWDYVMIKSIGRIIEIIGVLRFYRMLTRIKPKDA